MCFAWYTLQRENIRTEGGKYKASERDREALSQSHLLSFIFYFLTNFFFLIFGGGVSFAFLRYMEREICIFGGWLIFLFIFPWDCACQTQDLLEIRKLLFLWKEFLLELLKLVDSAALPWIEFYIFGWNWMVASTYFVFFVWLTNEKWYIFFFSMDKKIATLITYLKEFELLIL